MSEIVQLFPLPVPLIKTPVVAQLKMLLLLMVFEAFDEAVVLLENIAFAGALNKLLLPSRISLKLMVLELLFDPVVLENTIVPLLAEELTDLMMDLVIVLFCAPFTKTTALPAELVLLIIRSVVPVLIPSNFTHCAPLRLIVGPALDEMMLTSVLALGLKVIVFVLLAPVIAGMLMGKLSLVE